MSHLPARANRSLVSLKWYSRVSEDCQMTRTLKKSAISVRLESSDSMKMFCWGIIKGSSKVGVLKLVRTGECEKNTTISVWDMEIWLNPPSRHVGIATMAIGGLIREIKEGRFFSAGFPSKALLRCVTEQSNTQATRLFYRTGFLKTEMAPLGEIGQFAPEIWTRLVSRLGVRTF